MRLPAQFALAGLLATTLAAAACGGSEESPREVAAAETVVITETVAPPPAAPTPELRELCAKFSASVRKRRPPQRPAKWIDHANVVGLLAIQEMAELGQIEPASAEDAELIWNLVVFDGGIASAALNLETAFASNKGAIDDARAELEMFETQWDDFARQHGLAECRRFG